MQETRPTTDEQLPDAPEGQNPQEWRVTDRQGVEWYLRRQREDADQIAIIKQQAAAMIREIDSRMKRREARHLPDVEEWTRQEIERQGGKGKSVKTFQGTCAFRTVPGRWTIADAVKALAHAQSIGCVTVETVTTLAETEYLALAAASEEPLPGVEQIPARESFGISYPKGKE